MWLAHALTLSRIPIAIALVVAYGDRGWAVALIVLAAATDAADGTVARRMQRRGHTRPDIGGWLDPLVDKVFIVIVLATIWAHDGRAWVIAAIAARELLLVPLLVIYAARGRAIARLHAGTLGKIATIVQFVACAVAVVEPAWAAAVAVVAAVSGVAAVIDYVVRALRGRLGEPATSATA